MENIGVNATPQQYDIGDKGYIHETSRPAGMTTCFTSIGDDLSNPKKVGGGQPIKIVHNLGDPIEQSVYIDINVKQNRTFAHEGYIIWKNADFDDLTLETVPTLTKFTAGSNTNYNPYGGIIVPAAGDGHINVAHDDIRLVEMPEFEMGDGERPTAFWNAEYDPNTNTFTNIVPAPSGDGVYNMFIEEVILNRFASRLLLIDGGFLMLQTADSSEFGHGMRFKLSIRTDGEDHNWKAACIITMHRTRTA